MQLQITTTHTSTLGDSDAVKGDIGIPLMPKLNVLAFICMDRALSAIHESIWALFESSYFAACKDLSTYNQPLINCRTLQGAPHDRLPARNGVI